MAPPLNLRSRVDSNGGQWGFVKRQRSRSALNSPSNHAADAAGHSSERSGTKELKRLPTRIMRRVKVAALPMSNSGGPEEHKRSDSVVGNHVSLTMSENFTKDELQEFHQLFSMFDTDGSGAIGSEELKQAMMSICGLQTTDGEIDDLIREVDEDGNGEIDFEEFCHCIKRSQNIVKSTNEEVIRQCFEVFDQDENGVITENEFKYIAREIGGFTDDLAEQVFSELDISSNGYLTPDQFAAIVEDYMLSDNVRSA